MSKITAIHAREILDSRGNPTIEVELTTENGKTSRASVPSGASTGTHEALELRDADPTRYGGKGVQKALKNIREHITPALLGLNVLDQTHIDQTMLDLDGTPNKSRLGANAILGVSLATAHSAAITKHIPLYEHFATLANTPTPTLPTPFMNILNGGQHADNNLDIQEFMIAPIGFPTFSTALQAGTETFHTLKKILKEKNLATSVGDEGGFAPNLTSHHQALELITQAIHTAGHTGKIKIALDCAATEYYSNGHYHIEGKNLTATQLTDYYLTLLNNFPIISIEDPHAEDDFPGFQDAVNRLSNKCQIVGDDLLVTNPTRIKQAINQKTATAALIKINQIGTLTETIQAVQTAHTAGWKCMISHRSGETEDTTIADLAVGLATGQIKTGSASRSERLCKYNQLLRIEESLPNAYHPNT